MTTWLECSTLAEPEAVDALAELFGAVGQGVAIEEPVVGSPDGEQVRIDPRRPVLVKTYLPLDEQTAERRRQLEEGVWHLGRLRQIAPLQVRTLEEREWAEAWKQYFFAHRVGERLVIVPSWRDHAAAPGDIVIRLDPGMAFGTGLHPTTRLCLRALERYVRGGESVLDLGTGSGILAIAAAQLGARRVLALDVDAVAVRVAAENVSLNSVRGVVEIRQGSLDGERGLNEAFDLVVANISLRVLRQLQPAMRTALQPGGLALLSGVLEQDLPLLREEYLGAGWRMVGQETEAEWALLVCSPVQA